MNDREFYTYRKLGALPILPRHIWNGTDPITWEIGINDFKGSGPYKISSYGAGYSIKLVKNAEYYPEIDTDPPILKFISIYPDNPIPAENVVIRIFVEDRNLIKNVTLSFTYQIGGINTTESRLMIRDAMGYIVVIPSHVTATYVEWQIEVTDSWGNSAILASGFYPNDALGTEDVFEPIVILSIGISGVAIAIVVILGVRRKRTK